MIVSVSQGFKLRVKESSIENDFNTVLIVVIQVATKVNNQELNHPVQIQLSR
jgi:hypothetical protein